MLILAAVEDDIVGVDGLVELGHGPGVAGLLGQDLEGEAERLRQACDRLVEQLQLYVQPYTASQRVCATCTTDNLDEKLY